MKNVVLEMPELRRSPRLAAKRIAMGIPEEYPAPPTSAHETASESLICNTLLFAGSAVLFVIGCVGF
jgi:hypothetical protein